MIPLGPVVARARLQAARSAAWAYLADADRRAEWWPELRLEPQVGGAIAERWTEDTGETSVSRDASGTVDVWVDGHAIGFTWREAGDLRDTAVLLTLRSQGLETGITVTETGFDGLPESAARAAGSQDGWQVLLRDLSLAVASAVAAGTLPAGAEPAVPDLAVSDEAVSDQAVSDEAVPDLAAPDQTVSDQAVSDLAVSDLAVPDQAVSDQDADAGSTEAGEPEPEPEPEAGTASDRAADQTGDAPMPEAATDATPAEQEAGNPEPASPGAGELTGIDEPTGIDDDLNDTVRIERLPAVPAAAEPALAATDVVDETPDLDFDALIRGDQPEQR